MEFDVEVTQSAALEVTNIVSYLRGTLQSEQDANNFLKELDHQIDLISDLPDIYAVSKIDVVRDFGYRVAHVNKYVLLYDFGGTKVTVEHVFYGLQDYGRLI